MKIMKLFFLLLFICSSLLRGDDFFLSPKWVMSSDGKAGYLIYDSYAEISLQEAEADAQKISRFSNKVWRGATERFVDSKIANQTILSKACISGVLLKRDAKWIELLSAPGVVIGNESRNAFLFIETDAQQNIVRKSVFFIKDLLGAPKFGEVLSLNKDFALVKIGVGVHEWVKIVLVDLNTFSPKACLDVSELEITEFSYGQLLKLNYKDPVLRSSLLADPDAVDNKPWKAVTIMENGQINSSLMDDALFELYVPPLAP